LSIQQDLEDQALSEGAKRFQKRLIELTQDGDATSEGAARKLMLQVLEPAITALQDAVENADRRGYGRSLITWIKRLGADTVAYMAIKVMLGSHVDKEQNIQHLAPRITKLMVDEWRYRKLKKEARGLFEYRTKTFNTSNYDHKSHSLNQAARYVGIAEERMGDREGLVVGVKIINIILNATGIGEIKTERRKRRGKWTQKKLLALSDETKKLIQDTNGILQFLRPQALPMVVPPLPWSESLKGGYHFALRGKYPLIRKSRTHPDECQEIDFVFEGLNKIQETGWRINKKVLAVVSEVYERGLTLGGIPNPEPEPLPQKPQWMHLHLKKEFRTEEQERQLRAWKKAASEIKERNNLRASRLIEWVTALDLAKDYEKYDVIYFPHNLDFRGRIYPICSGLQPQGSDIQRGLLEFAEGLPLGEDGSFWLAVHGANCLGEFNGLKFSKVPFKDRVEWIRANTDRLRGIAEDPLADTMWSDADEPFQFLAFCMEWAAYVEADNMGRGELFSSHLPIGQDGSCNGLQHFSAMLRDPEGARQVNLFPAGYPQDVYDTIHHYCRDRISADAVAGVAEAKWWLQSGLLSRKLFKRPTMTFAYGSKTFGMAKQLEEHILGEDNFQEIVESTTPLGDGLPYVGPLCQYLAKLIWSALESVVVAAFQGMEWMAECAGMVCDAQKVVKWKVPITNFPVTQEYWDAKRHLVETVLAGKAIKLSTYKTTKKPLRTKHKNAIAPNIIHSLDAAALVMTVVRASEEGISHFGMVHDSYSTHACNVTKLRKCTADAFVALYDGVDVAQNLHHQFRQANPDVPPPPPSGDFDVHLVKDAMYFFS
jgi:DNA-directed RNA polymerase